MSKNLTIENLVIKNQLVDLLKANDFDKARKLIVESNFDINYNYTNNFFELVDDDLPKIKFLLEMGIDINLRGNTTKQTPLDIFLTKGQEANSIYLIKLGAQKSNIEEIKYWQVSSDFDVGVFNDFYQKMCSTVQRELKKEAFDKLKEQTKENFNTVLEDSSNINTFLHILPNELLCNIEKMIGQSELPKESISDY